jgi:hypothetical protein
MVFADYLYYKFALFFFKGDGKSGSRAGIAVSIMYTAVLWTVCVYLAYRIEGGPWVDKYLKQLVISVSIIWCIIVYANYRRYNKRFDYLHSKWENESASVATFKTLASMLAYFLILALSIKITHELSF